jgi:glycine cleavage system transcriptional repressor
MAATNNYLIITALGSYQPDTIQEFSRVCAQYGCNILNAKTNVMGKELVLNFLISGNWGAIAKMEAALPSLEKKLGFTLFGKRTTENTSSEKSIGYSIQISAIDKAGILNGLSDFLFRLSIPIEEMNAHTYSSTTGTQMLSINLKINVSENFHLATFREQFMSYCDDNNLDAFLEPVRN